MQILLLVVITLCEKYNDAIFSLLVIYIKFDYQQDMLTIKIMSKRRSKR